MKRLLVAAALALGVCAPASAAIPLGVNFSGMNYIGGQQWPVKQAVDYYLVEKHMKVVRLNLMWELMQPTLGGPLDPAQIAGISDQVTRITATGATVIIEPHNDFRRSVGGTDRIIGQDPLAPITAYTDFWTKVARQWRANPKVVFELMNEPHDQVTGTLVQVENAGIAAIRATGAKNLILVAPAGWNPGGWQWGADNRTQMLGIVDPTNNFAFDIHVYFDDHNQGQSSKVIEQRIWSANIVAFQNWARANGKRGFLGEFASPQGAAGDKALHSLLTILNANQDVWIGATWWGAGGWWPHDYLFLLDPYGASLEAANPFARQAVDWRPRIDKPQMKVLDEFLH